MAIVLPDQGESMILEMAVGKTAVQNLILRLYTSNTTPAETDTESTYTETTFTGYSAITLTAGNWSVTGTAPSSAGYAQQTFTSSAGSQNVNVYGYYFTQVTSGKLIWVERFTDGPYNIANNGDTIRVTPNFTMA
jgi:hypothetical protein